MRRREFAGALALGLAGCAHEIREPVSVELLALRYLMTIREAEDEYRRAAGRYGSFEEIAAGVSRRSSPGRMTRLMEAYEFRVEAEASWYRAYAGLKRGDLARRTFFMDQTGVMRESWGPEAASAGSREVK